MRILLDTSVLVSALLSPSDLREKSWGWPRPGRSAYVMTLVFLANTARYCCGRHSLSGRIWWTRCSTRLRPMEFRSLYFHYPSACPTLMTRRSSRWLLPAKSTVW